MKTTDLIAAYERAVAAGIDVVRVEIELPIHEVYAWLSRPGFHAAGISGPYLPTPPPQTQKKAPRHP